MEKIFNITVDIGRKLPAPAFEVNTNDLKSVKLLITITNGQTLLNLTDTTVRIAIRKPDSHIIFQDCTVKDATNGQVEIILENQAYITPGTHTAEIMCYKGSEVVAVSGTFSYKSTKGIMNDEAVQSKSEFTTITGMLKDVQDTIEDFRENGTGVDAKARQDIQSVTTQLADTSQQLETAIKYPVLEVEKDKVTRKDFPYGHVERYGADPTGENDSTIAIQTAIDVMEELAKGITAYPSGFFKVQFGSGNYKITKTIRLKYDSTKHSTSSPITIVGNERKRVADQLGKGTVIRPLIPNHTGKSYANAFSINIRYNSVDNEDDTIAFDTEPLQTVNSIMFKDITFTLTDEESELYNICAIKGYRFRIDCHNLCFTNLWRGIWQPEKDRLNKYSYCDFSKCDDLSFTGMKLSCLELYVPDASTIKRIYNHRPKATFDHIVKITKGASIRMETIHHAMHGTFVDGSLVPRNDGSGQAGTKALIKIIESSVSISDIYAERSLVDYVLHLTDVTSLKLDTYEGKFVGNGFLSINGTNNHNIIIENVKRNENIVSEYLDFYIAPNATFSGLKVKNYIPRQYYSTNISLSTPLTNLVPNTDSSFITRDIKHNFTSRQYRHIEGETVVFKVYYDGATWQSRDIYGNDMTNALGSFVWSSDRLSFNGSKLNPCKLLSIEPAYISGNQLPHIPIRRGDNIDGIRFYDRATGQAISTPDTKCSVMVTVMCILNMTKLP